MLRGPTKRTTHDDNEQSKAFIEKAREIEADEKHSAAGQIDGAVGKDEARPSQDGTLTCLPS